MNGQEVQSQMQYQLMYNQLIGQYAGLATNYHAVAEENLQLYSQL
jgi:hypothetical protein